MSRVLFLSRLLCVLFLALGSVALGGWTATESDEVASQSAVGTESRGPGFESDVKAVAAYLERCRSGLTDADIARLAPVVVAESRRSGFPLELVLAVIQVESSGNNFARSHAGALGLMQLHPATAQVTAGEIGIPWQGDGTLFDPADNVRLGVAYLEGLVSRFGDLPTALAAYNWGPTRISRFLQRGRPIPTTYADRVLRTFERGV
jgi:soluble lytic murein transglycosylase